MEHLSLVVQIVNICNLLDVRCGRRRQLLIHVLLSNWNVVFHIGQVVLVEEVVVLVIHSFHDMVPHIVMEIRSNLEHCLLNVVDEVPSNHSNELFSVVFCENLDYILLSGFNEF